MPDIDDTMIILDWRKEIHYIASLSNDEVKWNEVRWHKDGMEMTDKQANEIIERIDTRAKVMSELGKFVSNKGRWSQVPNGQGYWTYDRVSFSRDDLDEFILNIRKISHLSQVVK